MMTENVISKKNPFINIHHLTKSEYVSSKCSLNRAIMAQVHLKGVDDDIEGRCFKDIFSTGLIVNEIKKRAAEFGVDLSKYRESHLPMFLDRALVSNDIIKKQMANLVISKYGKRLGLIFLALKTGLQKNRDARPEWNDRNWEYWNDLETVVLVGGLASGMVGRHFKEHIFYVFDKANVKPYEIRLFDNGTYVGVLGASNALMKDDTTSLVLDLGHTNIKRCIVSKERQRIVSLNPVESLPTPYMRSSFDDESEKLEYALRLHKYLVNLIADTYKMKNTRDILSDDIIVSIANYNSKGVLNNMHGGYSKLSMLGDDYEKLLSEDISSELRKSVSVRLVHDGTANALYFRNIENSCCISLGTAFGIGFPDIDIS